jgi:hypothetical protein
MIQNIRRWRGVPGTLCREVYFDAAGVLCDAAGDKPLPAAVQAAAAAMGLDRAGVFDLLIDFDSSGYYDPGSMYGGRDRLGSPPEGDDERIVRGAAIDRLPLPKEAVAALADCFYDSIAEVEIKPED